MSRTRFMYFQPRRISVLACAPTVIANYMPSHPSIAPLPNTYHGSLSLDSDPRAMFCIRMCAPKPPTRQRIRLQNADLSTGNGEQFTLEAVRGQGCGHAKNYISQIPTAALRATHFIQRRNSNCDQINVTNPSIPTFTLNSSRWRRQHPTSPQSRVKLPSAHCSKDLL